MVVTKQQLYIIRDTQQDILSKDTTSLLKHEITMKQYRIIKNWKPQSDVWPLTFGRSILISATAITSIYINHRFRARLKLRDYGTFPTMLGLAISPAAATAFLHTEFSMNKLLLLEIPCPLCMESRSALAQTCSGVFLPLILAPIANFSISAGSGIYNVPYITDIRGICRTVLSIYQPMIPKIVIIFTFHALLAGFVTYLEIKSFLRLLDMQYLIKEEEKQKFK